MDASSDPLTLSEIGPYAEIAARTNPQHLVIQAVPSISAILLSSERNKGSPLTKLEVEAIVSTATVMVVLPEMAGAVDERRGYSDVDPSRAWEDWQVLRVQLR